jgi:hypothetical protein
MVFTHFLGFIEIVFFEIMGVPHIERLSVIKHDEIIADSLWTS